LTRVAIGTIYRGQTSTRLQDVGLVKALSTREGRRIMAAKKKAKAKAKKK
jgi:hypothetical protein